MASSRKSNRCNLSEARKSTILGASGETTSFGALLDQQSVYVKRTLVVFIRHFFCGNCQEYVRRLASDLAPSALPKDVSVIIIGCGAPSIIPSYVEVTECPFPLYADPSTQLYKLLGMQRSLSLGSKGPAYIQHSLTYGALKSIVQGLKRIPSGDVAKAGDLSVNGGEFLFCRDQPGSNWKVSWSHTMKNSRDHTEVDDLKKRLQLNGIANEDRSSADSTSEALVNDSSSCSDMSVCSQPSEAMKKSMQRRSWLARAGQLTRSSSLRRSIIQVS